MIEWKKHSSLYFGLDNSSQIKPEKSRKSTRGLLHNLLEMPYASYKGKADVYKIKKE
jgi:hypothetical protein